VVARYDVAFDSTVSPFQLCAAHVENNAARLLIARALSTSGSRARSATFELSELRLDLAHTNGGDSAPETVAPAWSLAGADLPYWASWDGGWVVLSEDAFTAPVPEQEKVETEEERGARERKEKEERLGLGATLPPVTASAEPAETPIGETETADVEMADETQYPFRWTQDTSSVTITMPVPPGTSRSALDVRLAPSSVTVSITGELEPPLSNFAGRTHALWTEIRADESTWTFDSSSNEIALELTKAEGDGTRWPSVFVPGEDDEDEEDFEDVPETFETATLDAVRASFASVRTRETGADTPGSEPRGNAPAVAALAREDMDLDWEDDEYAADGAFADMGASAGLVGRSVLVGFVRDASEGVNATWSRQPVAVLSLPAAPGATDLIVKSAVDGLRFAAPSEDPARTPWTHVGTTPARPASRAARQL
jgi:hypothetical protein